MGEDAIVLNFVGTKIYYQLFTTVDGPWRKVHDLGYLEDTKWRYLSGRNKLFPDCRRKGLKPPYGGGLEIDSAHWYDVGCTRYHCVIPRPDSLRFQEFENGYILGPYRKSYDNAGAEYYVLINGKPWENVEVLNLSVTPCDTPDGDYH